MRFDRVEHLTRIRATLGEMPVQLLVDTGIGVNVVSPEVAETLALPGTGETFAGRRMSGQLIEAPLVRLPPVCVDGRFIADQVAAVLELGSPDGEHGFSGILGLTTFRDHPLTVDPQARTLVLGSPPGAAYQVDLDVRRDGHATDSFVDLVLPSGVVAHVELDTGSASLILDTRYLERGEVALDGDVETIEETDETGHPRRRLVARLAGGIHLVGAPETALASPALIAQDIIHDGLVGTDFLDRFRWTIDVGRAELRLTPQL